MGLIGDLLERAARATPATVEQRGAGWLLRHADNGTWWSGAVLAHGAVDGLAERIDDAERFYAEHHAVARFQVCAGCPGALDRSLAERGYRWEAPIRLLTAVAGAPTTAHATPGMTVRVDTSLSPDWLAVLGATSPPGIDVEHETKLLRRVDRPSAYLTVLADGEPVGIGRAVADDGWTGIFHMATIPAARRRGVAHLVLSATASWADAHSAARLYLQVEQSNVGARGLYDAAGFTRFASYHYRARATHTDR